MEPTIPSKPKNILGQLSSNLNRSGKNPLLILLEVIPQPKVCKQRHRRILISLFTQVRPSAMIARFQS